MSDKEKTKDKKIDEATGVELKDHEWDGLRELNNPLPRWWVWVWIVSIVWAVWYMVVYPSWPVLNNTTTGATEGTSGYTQFKELEAGQQEIFARQKNYLEKFEKASFDEILNDQSLYAFAIAGGSSTFKDNCATCHGTGGAGAKGYPNLNDDDWLWGGKLSDIYQTIQYGINSEHEETRFSQMSSFGVDETLTRDEINKVVDYVLTLSGGDKQESYYEGMTIFEEQCSACHGESGTGGRDFGAPNLTDKIWLYGGDRETVFETVYYGRTGLMPTWKDRLDDNTIRQLTVYLHQLGGGEKDLENVEEEGSRDE